MITIIHSSNRTIKSFCGGVDPTCDAAAGETVEYLDVGFSDYANRLVISALGKTGVTLTVPQGSESIPVTISCSGHSAIDISVNGISQTVPLVNGKGEFSLSAQTPGVYVIAPTDRTTFCAAGNGLLCIEVIV